MPCTTKRRPSCGGVSFEALAVQHPRATLWPSPPQGGARFSGTISCFPLRGNAALAAKGCTRLRVEMKRKGCPDHQTAACLDGVSFEALAVQHPRATLWPSPPRWEACHLILSRLRLPANQVPLPPQGGAHGGKLAIRTKSHKKGLWKNSYHFSTALCLRKKLLIRPILMHGRAQAFCFDEWLFGAPSLLSAHQGNTLRFDQPVTASDGGAAAISASTRLSFRRFVALFT